MELEKQVVSPSGRKLRGGGYSAIHHWLKKNFGSANKCTNPLCCKTRKKYHYALLKGKNHEHKRENYVRLCTMCHFHYDITMGRRKRQSSSLKGKKHTEQHKSRISQAMKGKNLGNKNACKKGVKNES